MIVLEGFMTCPCCKGAKMLEVFDAGDGNTIKMPCCHCMMDGVVPAGVNHVPQEDIVLSELNTSDIPTAEVEFFERARLVLPEEVDADARYEMAKKIGLDAAVT